MEPSPRRVRRVPTMVVLLLAVVIVAVVASTAPIGVADGSEGARSQDTTTTTRPTAPTTPSGKVAYATADGRVWVGVGAGPPVEVASGAAIGRGEQSAVALAPTGDVVAFVRADRSLAIVPVGGGTPTVVANDVAVATLGSEQLLAWSPRGERIAYVATGTQAMADAAPRRDDPVRSGSFASPLPIGVLGNVVQVVDRTGRLAARIGNPAERNYVGVTSSPVDEILLLSSTIPGTSQRYTLVTAGFASNAEVPTLFSLDQPQFGPDGTYFVAVGSAKGQRELIAVTISTFSRLQLAVAERICGPVPSPDGTRVAFGSGPTCARLQLVPATGGVVLDVTPPDEPDTVTYDAGTLGWTTEGRFVTAPRCRLDAGRIGCGGPSRFLDPDTGRVVDGPSAATVVPERLPLVGEAFLDVSVRGRQEFRASFRIDVDTQASLTQVTEDGRISGSLTDAGGQLDLDLATREGGPFVTGRIAVVDAETGTERTLTVLGRLNAVGLRVFGISGIWMTTDEVPFASGKFDLAVRRR